MNETNDPLSALVFGIAEEADRIDRLPPHRRTLTGASMATELLAWCVYLAPLSGHRSGTPFYAWAGFSALCAVWLLAAFWMSRGQQRDFVAVFWALLFGGGAAALLWWRVYPPDWGPVAVFFLRGFYLSALAVSAVRLLLAARPFAFGGSAERIIRRQLQRRNAPVRPARWRGRA